MSQDAIKSKLNNENKILKGSNNELFLREENLIIEIYQNIDEEFYEIIKPIIESKEFISSRLNLHHDNISTYSHCLQVSYIAYKDAKKRRLNYQMAAIGGLLHDFYLYDWHNTIQENPGIFNMHLFAHPVIACQNAKKHYPTLINKKVENMILAHSWHMYIIKKLFKFRKFNLKNHIPKSKEAWIVSFADIKASMYSAKNPVMAAKSLGLDKHYHGIKYWILKHYAILFIISIFH